MILLILIYVITLILFGVFIYIDMDKGETLQDYFHNMEITMIICITFIPILNTFFVILLLSATIFEKIWDRIKYWKK